MRSTLPIFKASTRQLNLIECWLAPTNILRSLQELSNEGLLGLALFCGLEVRCLPVIIRSCDVLINELGNAGVEFVAAAEEIYVVGAIE